MYRFLVSIATPSGLRMFQRLEAADRERAAYSAREAAKADPVLRKQILRITVYIENPDYPNSDGPQWVAVFGLIDDLSKLHSGNL